MTSEIGRNLSAMVHNSYGVDNRTAEAVDYLQVSLRCCGVNSFEDWRDSEWWATQERRNNKVPDSCCITPGRFCGVRDHPSNIRYTGWCTTMCVLRRSRHHRKAKTICQVCT